MVSDLLISDSSKGQTALSQENKIDISRENDEAHLNERRRAKFLTFMIYEASALGVLIPSLVFGLLWGFGDPTLAVWMNVLTFTAAAAVVLIPIIFYATASTLPRGER